MLAGTFCCQQRHMFAGMACAKCTRCAGSVSIVCSFQDTFRSGGILSLVSDDLQAADVHSCNIAYPPLKDMLQDVGQQNSPLLYLVFTRVCWCRRIRSDPGSSRGPNGRLGYVPAQYSWVQHLCLQVPAVRMWNICGCM